MRHEDFCDIAIVGAGASGLAAGAVCARAGLDTRIIDREDFVGGILKQCIHNGFGLRYYKAELTGPEYAYRAATAAKEAGAKFTLSTTVSKIEHSQDLADQFILTLLSANTGVTMLQARKLILATGSRERSRGAIATPGSRPAGVFTAGTAQRILNLDGYLPGKRAVIIGSGDIGLIMARRLTWSGVKVLAVVEIQATPSGLTRNIAQCLNDFDIPLYLEHAVTRIIGKDRVEQVQIAPLSGSTPELDASFILDCDTVLFSVGLLPENELARSLGVQLNPATGGPIVDESLQTNVSGIYTAGNALHIHDLVDYVSEEAEWTAKAIVEKLTKPDLPAAARLEVAAGMNLKYVMPNYCTVGCETNFYFRAMIECDSADLIAEQDSREVLRRHLRYVKPAEMLRINYVPDAGSALHFSLVPVINT